MLLNFLKIHLYGPVGDKLWYDVYNGSLTFWVEQKMYFFYYILQKCHSHRKNKIHHHRGKLVFYSKVFCLMEGALGPSN